MCFLGRGIGRVVVVWRCGGCEVGIDDKVVRI